VSDGNGKGGGAFVEEKLYPQLLSVLVSDDVALSDLDEKVSIHRVFLNVWADAFPAKLERMAISTIWVGGQGVHRVGVVLEDPDGNEIGRGTADLAMGPADDIHVFYLNDIVFPKPGNYLVKVSLNGVDVYAFDFLVGQKYLEEEGEAAEVTLEGRTGGQS
jgi:hypothetical protein